MRVREAGSMVLVVLAAVALWRFVLAMPAYSLTAEEFVALYQPVSADGPEPAGTTQPLVFEFVEARRARFQFAAHDGDRVTGYIEWPQVSAAQQSSEPGLLQPDSSKTALSKTASAKQTSSKQDLSQADSSPQAAALPAGARFPVLLGLSAMGQSAQRWWLAEYKGRPTLTGSHRIREMAIAAGYAVVTIDNRYTDTRKDPDRSIDAIMSDLHVFGDRTDYEQMIHGTVMDLRLLLDKLALQPELDMQRVTAMGYSMGGQVGLLLAAVDARVRRLIAVVPPWLDNRTAKVSPRNAAPLIANIPVLLITANDDEYASVAQNAELFQAIASPDKQHVRIDAGHLLPADYVDVLRPLFFTAQLPVQLSAQP